MARRLLSRRGPKTVRIKIVKNSVIDTFGLGYGKGEYTVDAPTAEHFASRGAAVILDRVAVAEENTEEEPKAPDEKGAQASASESDSGQETALPDDFPEKAKLEEAGFTTLESLGVEGAADEIAKIPGIGPAAIKKIGLALAELDK